MDSASALSKKRAGTQENEPVAQQAGDAPNVPGQGQDPPQNAEVPSEGQEDVHVHGNQRNFDGPYDEQRARGLIDNLRTRERTLQSEKQKAASDLQAAQARLKEYEDAQLTEQQRIAKDLEEKNGKISSYEQRVRDLSVQNAVMAEAVNMNIVSPLQAARLLDTKAIQFDADGNATNVKEVLTALLADSPWLVKTAAVPPASNGQGAPKTPPANPARDDAANKVTFSRAQLSDFPFYTANKAAIMQAMREGRITD